MNPWAVFPRILSLFLLQEACGIQRPKQRCVDIAPRPRTRWEVASLSCCRFLLRLRCGCRLLKLMRSRRCTRRCSCFHLASCWTLDHRRIFPGLVALLPRQWLLWLGLLTLQVLCWAPWLLQLRFVEALLCRHLPQPPTLRRQICPNCQHLSSSLPPCMNQIHRRFRRRLRLCLVMQFWSFSANLAFSSLFVSLSYWSGQLPLTFSPRLRPVPSRTDSGYQTALLLQLHLQVSYIIKQIIMA